ncbi:hypothetical protein [Arthrobacter sp. ISL-65]|uniref:hypothetical protein n=1 Tax=Arthrobacter sp. ISL-65 TaxID=2819112 RepID=UPI001BEAF5E5|nr:hypothetical protein [Arthrobacter sp. ISL-65]MBT2550544.1 hypothetical protein [Arthrobacter sp. ISL-65]
MRAFTKATAGAVFAGSLLFAGGMAPATAAPPIVVQDGLVNVSVGDISILNDARIGVAAQVAATICGVKVGPVAVLATQVDRSGATATVCTTDQGPVTISQN